MIDLFFYLLSLPKIPSILFIVLQVYKMIDIFSSFNITQNSNDLKYVNYKSTKWYIFFSAFFTSQNSTNLMFFTKSVQYDRFSPPIFYRYPKFKRFKVCMCITSVQMIDFFLQFVSFPHHCPHFLFDVTATWFYIAIDNFRYRREKKI